MLLENGHQGQMFPLLSLWTLSPYQFSINQIAVFVRVFQFSTVVIGHDSHMPLVHM